MLSLFCGRVVCGDSVINAVDPFNFDQSYMPKFINEPVNRLMDWWAALPWPVQLVTWPIIFPISILNLVVTVPEIAWYFMKPQGTVEIKVLKREQLVDWGTQLESRLNSMLEVNPPECHEILKQPRDDVREMLDAITGPRTDYEQLKIRADELANEYEQWKGEPPSQVHGLCLHVSKWCDSQNAG